MSVHEVISDPDPLIVKALEDLLASAKAGKIFMIAFSAAGEEEYHDKIVAAPCHYYQLHSHMALLSSKIQELMYEELYGEA